MAQHQQRVIRAYSLPVELFDHLKANQRHLQRRADVEAGTPATEGDLHWVTNSGALVDIVSIHYRLGYAAGKHDMLVDDFVTALCMGDLKAVKATA
jgi:hypothetical protein